MKLKEGIEINESKFEYIIDSEFANLCNFLLDEEFVKLENSIKVDGCRDSLVVWDEKDILLDGHHRLYFCQKHNKPYQIIKKSFPDRFSALLWAWSNDKGRRGSGDSPYYDCETVLLKFKDGLEKKAREKQLSKLKKGPVLTHGSKRGKPINVRKELANLAHYSEMTVNRTKFIMKYADEETKRELRKRKPTVKFRALAEKFMMLYPEKQDSEKELKFKESLDKETILDTLNLPQAQKFVKVAKEVEDITPEQQKRIAKKIKESKDLKETSDIRRVVLEEKHKKEPEKKSKQKMLLYDLRDEIKETNSLSEKLSSRLLTLTRFRDEIGDEVYKNEIKALVININVLMQRLKTFLGGKNVKRIKG